MNKLNNGGGGRIRTIEGGAGRFTVCSLWPLGNPSTAARHIVYAALYSVNTFYDLFNSFSSFAFMRSSGVRLS